MRFFTERRSPAVELPCEVRRRLIESSFADTTTTVSGAVVTGFCGFLFAFLTHSAGPAAAAIFALCTLPVRLHLIRGYRASFLTDDAKQLQSIERGLILGGVSTLLCAGFLAITTFRISDDPFVLTISFAIVMLNLLAIAIRYFGLRDGIVLQICAGALPLAAACVLKGGLFFLIPPVALAPLCLFIYKSAAKLRQTLLDEITFREQSQKIAAQFDAAINNMSHGLCTLDGEGRIVVFNDKFRTVLSLPPEALLAGCDIYALLGEAIPQLVTNAQYMLGDQALLPDQRFGSDTTINVETRDGRTIELTIHTMDTEGSVLVVQDVTDRFNAERKIQYMAHFDAVTGLPNRHAFETTLAESLDQLSPGQQSLTILFLDLDNFKQINDSLGHRTGDKVLLESAVRLRQVIEPDDFIARWGGDEFIILHTHDLSAPTDGHTYTKRLIEEVRRPLVIDGSEVIVGVSIGSATAFSHGVSADALLSNADLALYAAKADGRGCWRMFEPEMDTRIQARRLLELELRNAVSSKDITVNFQPIVNVTTGRITAFEALARWRSPSRGNVPPSDFIPLLEETGLIHEVGGMILRRACAACARWPDSIAVSVNLSPIQFREQNLETTIADAVSASGLEPHRLILEITESTLFDDRIGVRNTLASLRTCGIQVSLDDFGTGYSNFGHLHSYPFDRIKIDRSFTLDLGRKQTSWDLVESIADLGRRLRKPVIAEGVETLMQLTTVRLLKIAEAQGYLFGKPVPESEVAALIARDHEPDPARTLGLRQRARDHVAPSQPAVFSRQ